MTQPIERRCDLCKYDLTGKQWVDGRTIMGPWATMCRMCHNAEGVGFGTGKGQLFAPDGTKLEG